MTALSNNDVFSSTMSQLLQRNNDANLRSRRDVAEDDIPLNLDSEGSPSLKQLLSSVLQALNGSNGIGSGSGTSSGTSSGISNSNSLGSDVSNDSNYATTVAMLKKLLASMDHSGSGNANNDQDTQASDHLRDHGSNHASQGRNAEHHCKPAGNARTGGVPASEVRKLVNKLLDSIQGDADQDIKPGEGQNMVDELVSGYNDRLNNPSQTRQRRSVAPSQPEPTEIAAQIAKLKVELGAQNLKADTNGDGIISAKEEKALDQKKEALAAKIFDLVHAEDKKEIFAGSDKLMIDSNNDGEGGTTKKEMREYMWEQYKANHAV